jgi:TRAP-type mannitol/chloroaromatic compound transport system permease small subunit
MNEYLSDIAKDFCPFLKPAIDKKLCKFLTYNIATHSLIDAQEFLFCAGLMHTASLRLARKEHGRYGYLYCENAILVTSEAVTSIGSELFAWPHWCLKTLYTKSAVVYGKFWIGEEDTARDGRPIPAPSVHLLSVRSAIKAKDGRFFKKAAMLRDDFEQSKEANEDPLIDIVDRSTHALIRSVLDNPVADEAGFRKNIDKLVEMNLYPGILQKVKKMHGNFH